MELRKIEIDLETYKAIESWRKSFEESHNDILRRVFANTQVKEEKSAQPETGGLLVRDGVFLQAGTLLRHIAKRSGKRYEAEVRDGGILFEGELYHSPSNAAVAAAGNNRNGWRFWEYYNPENRQWALLDSLRH